MRKVLSLYGYHVEGTSVRHSEGYWRGVIDDANKVAYLWTGIMNLTFDKAEVEGYEVVGVTLSDRFPYTDEGAGPNTVEELMVAVLDGEVVRA